MSTPAAKKQKTANAPIVFASPGFVPDVSLKVFDDWEFHVDSAHLKMHSAFFRKFLDSADKGDREDGVPISESAQRASTNTGSFRYQWVMQIDEDGKGWHLVEKSKAQKMKKNMPAFSGDQEFQKDVFEKLLNAIYNEPYTFEDFQDIETLTKFADYYSALKVVSRTMSWALAQSPAMTTVLKTNAWEMLKMANKLRNEMLFKECLILCVGPWGSPSFDEAQGEDWESDLRTYVSDFHNSLGSYLSVIDGILLEEATNEEDGINPLKDQEVSLALFSIARQACSKDDDGRRIQLPRYYRLISQSKILKKACPDVMRDIADLLKNNLALDKDAKVGEGPFEDYFLSWGANEAVPWDKNEFDW